MQSFTLPVYKAAELQVATQIQSSNYFTTLAFGCGACFGRTPQ